MKQNIAHLNIVKNDIMMSIDQNKAVVLVVLDLSAAFDIVDHDVLFFPTEKTAQMVYVLFEKMRPARANSAFCQIPCLLYLGSHKVQFLVPHYS